MGLICIQYAYHTLPVYLMPIYTTSPRGYFGQILTEISAGCSFISEQLNELITRFPS